MEQFQNNNDELAINIENRKFQKLSQSLQEDCIKFPNETTEFLLTEALKILKRKKLSILATALSDTQIPFDVNKYLTTLKDLRTVSATVEELATTHYVGDQRKMSCALRKVQRLLSGIIIDEMIKNNN